MRDKRRFYSQVNDVNANCDKYMWVKIPSSTNIDIRADDTGVSRKLYLDSAVFTDVISSGQLSCAGKFHAT